MDHAVFLFKHLSLLTGLFLETEELARGAVMLSGKNGFITIEG